MTLYKAGDRVITTSHCVIDLFTADKKGTILSVDKKGVFLIFDGEPEESMDSFAFYDEVKLLEE